MKKLSETKIINEKFYRDISSANDALIRNKSFHTFWADLLHFTIVANKVDDMSKLGSDKVEFLLDIANVLTEKKLSEGILTNFSKKQHLIDTLKHLFSKRGFQNTASRRYAESIVGMLPKDIIKNDDLLKTELIDIGSILTNFSELL